MVDYVALDGVVIKPIGDVHLGRRFRTGVPLHRLGEREQLVFDQFCDELRDCTDVDLVVQGGDIFDGLNVPFHLVLATAQAITEAALNNPQVTFVFIRGNHDAARDTNIKSAFDMLAALLRARNLPNVVVVDEQASLITIPGKTEFAATPWHPFKPVTEMVSRIDVMVSAVFTHCDVDGSDTYNLLPTEQLSKIAKTVFNWHVHKPETFSRHGVEVRGVGSMQPFAFGESLDEEFRDGPRYRTLTVDEYEATIAQVGPGAFHNDVIRFRLAEGETKPEDVDALQVVLQKINANGEEEQAVEFEDFNMNRLFVESMNELGVGDAVQNKVLAKLEELQEAENVV